MAGMLNSPAGASGGGFESPGRVFEMKKKNPKLSPKRKTLPTVLRIFQSLAHEQKSNTAHFKAS